MNITKLTRRDFLKSAGAAAAASLLPVSAIELAFADSSDGRASC
ncbi:MAG: hypothetical protein QG656_2602, partial [Candidatus Hydrogenedentes bacterium]|nr:hypothetical protein [Candidatus Hydrogenedentota bacterium]